MTDTLLQNAGISSNIAELPLLPEYKSILVAADASSHSDRGVLEAVAIAGLWNAKVTAAHVYAARLHDKRFRQMEGGLPDNYKEESELEKQRDIHDDLITRGLSVITDSYLDQAEIHCQQAGVEYARCSLEGKNYRELTSEVNSDRYDLLILGALGLGAVQSSRIGTVCERVVRRAQIDTLVIKDPDCKLTDGPILVCVDGSARSYGGLMTAISLAKAWQVDLHVISAFDPYYHYVAFNRIAGVLSEEAGKLFRFKEQEKLHEDIIDAGLAKIYQGHLDICETVAAEFGIKITTRLLDGKPYEVLEKYQRELKPGMLVLGKLGIHADDELDIGGNAENLLRNVDCAVLLSQREYHPGIELLAEASISWTTQAEHAMERVPVFARNMARLAVLRYAQERGHTVITEKIVAEATDALCPVATGNDLTTSERAHSHPSTVGDPMVKIAKPYPDDFHPAWSVDATRIMEEINDEAKRHNIRMRAEKKARAMGDHRVLPAHLQGFIEISDVGEMGNPTVVGDHSSADSTLIWTDAALERLEKVPVGFVRDLTRQRVEVFAQQHGVTAITPELMAEKYDKWREGSEKQTSELTWHPEALERVQRIPEFVRGMVIKEIERCAQETELELVTVEILETAKGRWMTNQGFHSEQKPDQYK